MNTPLLAYYIGIFIVFVTHAYMVSQNVMTQHAYLNLAAAALIAYYFMTKEGYLKA